VFNLEEFMCNEFLRPRENSCKLFNNLEVMRRGTGIVRRNKAKISHKINMVNRFRQQKTIQKRMKDDTIQCIRESIPVSPGWRMLRFILQMNRFSASQRVLWDDSN